MKYYEMLDVFKFIRDELNPDNTEAWQNYKETMEKFFEELEPYFDPGKKGIYIPITEKDYKRLDKLFDDAAKVSNDFVKSYKNIIEEERKDLPPIKDVAINFNNEFLAKAYVEYKNIKPNPNFSLRDQMENFRYHSVKLSNQDLKRLGAAQSDRTQMTVKLGGKDVKGVFTKKTFFDGKKELMPIFGVMSEKYPKYAKFFDGINKDAFYKEGIQSTQFNLLFDREGNTLYGEATRDAVIAFIASMRLNNTEKANATDFIMEEGFYEAMLDFGGKLSSISTPIVIGKNRIGMKEGDRIDMRNSAMSAVANLIGCPDAIAKSRALAIYDEQGKKYDEGTFMEFAKGKDINNLEPVDEMRLMEPDDFETPEVKEQLADLQVLDFICGNVDRHAGNMFYEIDPVTRKLKGVVGIDNDSSFTRVKIPYDKTYMRLPGVNNLKVINEHMANKIANLTEGQLKATLHGYGLDDASIKAAWLRTEQLKQAIINGKNYDETHYIPGKELNGNRPFITIMKKEDWKGLPFNQIHKDERNYFYTLDHVKRMPTEIEDVDVRTKLRRSAAYVGLNSAMGKTQTSYLLNKAKNASPWFFASTRYKNMVTKIKEYHEEKFEDANPLKNEKKWQKLQEMKNAINVYKQEKIRDGFIDEKWNMKRGLTGKDLDRVNLVKDLETYVDRIEKEKEKIVEIKKDYDDKKKKADDINDFLRRPRTKQENLVRIKLEKLAKEKVEEEPIVANEISNNAPTSIPNIEIENNLIKKEEVEIIGNDKNIDKAKEEQEDVLEDDEEYALY